MSMTKESCICGLSRGPCRPTPTCCRRRHRRGFAGRLSSSAGGTTSVQSGNRGTVRLSAGQPGVNALGCSRARAKIRSQSATPTRGRSFTYDPAGRLTQTVEGAVTRRYAYDADSNRCALAAACNAPWAYNAADQLTASPQATGYTYNSHGQLSAAARVDGKTENIGYAANDHAATIDDGTTTVTETLAPGGRVLERKVTNDTTHNLTEDTLLRLRRLR